MPFSDKWSKVGQNKIWDVKTLNKGDLFYGIYIDMEENVGANKSNIYNFDRYEDEDFKKFMGTWSIWGTSLLDVRFKGFEKGEEVGIEYLGETESQKRKGSTYHNFDVYHTRPEDRTSGYKDSVDYDESEPNGNEDISPEEFDALTDKSNESDNSKPPF